MIATLRRVPLVAILRSAGADRLPAVARTLVECGIRGLEFPLTTNGALEAIQEFVEDKPETVVAGAGTVRTREDVQAVKKAGAEFLVTPDCFPEVLAEAGRAQIQVVGGAFSPTEIATAARTGVDAVKVFPASLGGPEYIAAVRVPFHDVLLIPTGGVTIEDVPRYLQAGAFALGIGDPLLGDAAETGDFGGLKDRADALMRVVSSSGS